MRNYSVSATFGQIFRLSLRFNHEEFWDGLYSVPKLLMVAVCADSGALFERRVALGPARERLPLGLPGDLPQGFGAFAGVPSSTKSDETTRWTRTGVSLLPLS